jgi:hypothetical protein
MHSQPACEGSARHVSIGQGRIVTGRVSIEEVIQILDLGSDRLVEQVHLIVNMQCVIHSHILFLNALYTTLKAAVVNLLSLRCQSTAYILLC